MIKNILKYSAAICSIVIVLQLGTSSKAVSHLNSLADTPWPMFQHDPQHTGRSPLLGPTNQLEFLWSVQFDNSVVSSGGMAIAQDGSLLVPVGHGLYNFDPIKRVIRWEFPGGLSAGTPLVASDNTLYWKLAPEIYQLSKKGEIIWAALLGNEGDWGSSFVFGNDGNVYVGYRGLWSFSPDGQYRWFAPSYYGDYDTPSVDFTGKIYASGYYTDDICAYMPYDGSAYWCLDTLPYLAAAKISAIGSDGTIYLPTHDNALLAIDPSGNLDWEFEVSELVFDGIADGIALTDEGSIYFGVNTGVSDNYMYSVDTDGNYEWKIAFPRNPITQVRPYFNTPITVDRTGNAFICLYNSRCYGISPTGTIIWEYEFPSVDSILLVGTSQPMIGADGLIYIVDSLNRLNAFVDPSIYPLLSAPVTPLSYRVEPGTASFTTTIPVSSTIAPITYTAIITPSVEWLSIDPLTMTTPSNLFISFHPENLIAGTKQITIKLMPTEQSGNWIEIPVRLNIGVDPLYLPAMLHEYQTPYQLIFTSEWFVETQFASINQAGENREIISTVDHQTDWMVYSPDRTKVISVSSLTGQHQIYVLDIASGDPILEISNQYDKTNPTWSPESNRFAYISTQETPRQSDIFINNLNGTDSVKVYSTGESITQLIWSPSDNQFAVDINNRQAFVMDIGGTEIHPIQTGNFRD